MPRYWTWPTYEPVPRPALCAYSKMSTLPEDAIQWTAMKMRSVTPSAIVLCHFDTHIVGLSPLFSPQSHTRSWTPGLFSFSVAGGRVTLLHYHLYLGGRWCSGHLCLLNCNLFHTENFIFILASSSPHPPESNNLDTFWVLPPPMSESRENAASLSKSDHVMRITPPKITRQI